MNPRAPPPQGGAPSPLDPSLLIGVLPPGTTLSDRDNTPRQNAATAATAASVRAFTAQAIAFYFRAPVKAFFRTRVDYLAYARSLQAQDHHYSSSLGGATGAKLSGPGPTPIKQTWWAWLRAIGGRSAPGVIAHAVRHQGWGVIPDQVLPPLIANVAVGAVLYTSYLQILGQLHPESGMAAKRVYPPPSPGQTFTAGLLAGAIQSVAAAPLDAIQARYERGGKGPLVVGANGRPQSMWSFSYGKLREIGMRGIFAGWSLSLTKDSLGSAVFFSSFEYIKAQSYYGFVAWYYGDLSETMINVLSRKRTRRDDEVQHGKTIRPHYAIEPGFLLLAGMGASFAQQVVLHPLSHIQVEHWENLEALDAQAAKIRQMELSPSRKPTARWTMFRAYYHAYRETWAQCVAQAKAQEGNGPNAMRKWLYRGFWWSTIRQVPSTSAGLVIFELVRRKYGLGGEPVRINKDGYNILLA